MADLDQLKLGESYEIKVVARPTNVAARKTLERVLCKSADIRTESKRISRVREANFRTKQRGGRQWAINVPKMHPVTGELGESGIVRMTQDVARDLKSVSRFIEVSEAK